MFANIFCKSVSCTAGVGVVFVVAEVVLCVVVVAFGAEVEEATLVVVED